MQPAREENYSAEGVVIHIPALDKKIGVRKQTGKTLADFPAKAGATFRPKRLVTIFDLYDEDDAEAASGALSSPVSVRVRYTAEDAANAGGWQKLRLAYYKDGNWKPFSKAEHKFALEPDPNNPNQGYGMFELKTWGDPAISWGS
jgi:hypothetical protein